MLVKNTSLNKITYYKYKIYIIWSLSGGTIREVNFHSCTLHLDTIKVFYLPTDAQ